MRIVYEVPDSSVAAMLTVIHRNNDGELVAASDSRILAKTGDTIKVPREGATKKC